MLASRRSGEAYFREQYARAYRNSRDTLITQLRSEARLASFKANPQLAQQEKDLERRVAASGARIAATAPSEQAVSQLRKGLEVLRLHRPDHHALVAAWRGSESELLAVAKDTAAKSNASALSKEHRVVLAAWRIGYLLWKERQTPSTVPPPGLQRHANEIARANARARAVGVALPFPAESLASLPPAFIAGRLEPLRKAGLLAEGPEWTLRIAPAVPMLKEVGKTMALLAQQYELER